MHASAGHCAFVRAGRRAGAPPARIPAEAGSPRGLRDARPAGRQDAQCFTGLSSMPTPIVRLAPRAACRVRLRRSLRRRSCSCSRLRLRRCTCMRAGRAPWCASLCGRRPLACSGAAASTLARACGHMLDLRPTSARQRRCRRFPLYCADRARPPRRAPRFANPPTRTIRLPIIVTSRAAAPVPAAAIARMRVHAQRAACRSRCAV